MRADLAGEDVAFKGICMVHCSPKTGSPGVHTSGALFFTHFEPRASSYASWSSLHSGDCKTKAAAGSVAQLQQTIVGQQVSVNMALVMCGISKVFVGEIIEMGVPPLARRHTSAPPLSPHPTSHRCFTPAAAVHRWRAVQHPHMSPDGQPGVFGPQPFWPRLGQVVQAVVRFMP